MNYSEYREKTQKDFNEFSDTHMFYAFNKEQFEEGYQKLLKIKTEELICTGKLKGGARRKPKFSLDLVTIAGAGDYIDRSDVKKFLELSNKHNKMFLDEIRKDVDGTGFIRQMFAWELENHEYAYTEDVDETLRDLRLDESMFSKYPQLKKGLDLALRRYEVACV